MGESLVIGSRGSHLALWQANYIAGCLKELGVASEIQIIKTTGDHLQTASLVQAGGKGLFTKEIEDALLAHSIDVAVHSLKDLPTENPAGLTIAAIPEREDPRDALVGKRLDELQHGARVGTSSNRRASQLRLLRPDFVIDPVRGNVDTRLRKLHEGQYDAIVLAAAGLLRLGLENEIAQLFSPEQICPAPGQGALGIQTRVDDRARDICARLNDDQTARAVRCERAVLAALGGGCQLPIGAYAEVSGQMLNVQAGVFAPDGSRHVRTRAEGTDPEELGRRVAQELIAKGAQSICAL
ncbi:MAG: hydroxymethylbilane synthase [Acidobacteriota bacterium]|nr:hydroxymethylbilane synthase [Acidobacteriota bacterium]